MRDFQEWFKDSKENVLHQHDIAHGHWMAGRMPWNEYKNYLTTKNDYETIGKELDYFTSIEALGLENKERND